jgi:hypothetical protein
MKGMIFLSCLILSLVLIVSCATAPIKPISQADLPDLKGKWKGFYQDRVATTYIQPVELEIEGFKDLQVKGKITFGHADRPATSFPFYGKIESGKIAFSWQGGQYINLGLRKGGGKMELEGNYRIQQWEGTISLNKVE